MLLNEPGATPIRDLLSDTLVNHCQPPKPPKPPKIDKNLYFLSYMAVWDPGTLLNLSGSQFPSICRIELSKWMDMAQEMTLDLLICHFCSCLGMYSICQSVIISILNVYLKQFTSHTKYIKCIFKTFHQIQPEYYSNDKIDKLKYPRSFPAPYPSIWIILCGKLKEIATRTGLEGSQELKTEKLKILN